jgi:hypothetical protein
MMAKGQKFQPGWFTAIGGLVPPILALLGPLSPTTGAESALIGSTVGALVDGITYIRAHGGPAWYRNLRALYRKLGRDFEDSIIHSWDMIDSAYPTIITQLARAGLVKESDPRLNNRDAPSSLRPFLVGSRCWEGIPRWESLNLVESAGRWVVCTASIHAGIEAALMVMTEEFGLPLHVVDGYSNGIEQVEALNSGIDADFAVIADANVFMAANKITVNSYRYLLPCFWQKQYLVAPSDRRGYHHRLLWYATGSSGEEQVRLRAQSLTPYLSDVPQQLEIQDLPNKILELDKGEGLIAWEPFISVYCYPGASLDALEVGDYRLSTSLYCHKRLNTAASMPLRNAFQECFIAAWNRAKMSYPEMAVRLLARSEYGRSFGNASRPVI